MKITFAGLVDLQVNGFAGVDFNTPGHAPEQIRKALDAMRSTGVTRCLPTLITSSLEHFAACTRTILACADPAIAGLHMEGPYISPADGARGAHPQAHVAPASIEDFQRRQEAAGGHIRLVTLAPETPNALKLTEYLVAHNIRVAIGHTAATREQIRDGIHAGATLATHLGNGCPLILPRHDNVIWEQLAADELTASLIVDGHHLPPAVVKTMVRAKGLSRIVLVTDAIAAAAAPPGRYSLGEIAAERRADGRVTQCGATNLAGSSLTLDDALGNIVRFCGIALEDALSLASTQPARYLGLEPADMVEADWNSNQCHLTISKVSADAATKK